MRWVSDDGDHQGSLKLLVGDAVVWEISDSGGRVYDDTAVSFSEVTGWQAYCECQDGRRAFWTGATWIRVGTPEEDDAASGRLYAADDDVFGVVRTRPEVAIAAEAEWRHHAVPLAAYDRLKFAATSVLYDKAEVGLDQSVLDQNAYDRLRLAATSVQSAEAELDEAVADARRAGLSWNEVGRATGMRRQSAHERWA